VTVALTWKPEARRIYREIYVDKIPLDEVSRKHHRQTVKRVVDAVNSGDKPPAEDSTKTIDLYTGAVKVVNFNIPTSVVQRWESWKAYMSYTGSVERFIDEATDAVTFLANLPPVGFYRSPEVEAVLIESFRGNGNGGKRGDIREQERDEERAIGEDGSREAWEAGREPGESAESEQAIA